ncbi:MAG: hypothetical protein GY853_02175 [PVC group bacterium]|nr:hypothetical protein [PVC group bacterium]
MKMVGKKGMVGYVGAIITFTIAALLLANLLIPQTTNFDTLSTTSENVVKVADLSNETFTLTEDEVSLLTIAGLTLTTNYTVDNADTGVITLNDDTGNGTYAVSYSYEPEGYSDDAGTRALGGLIALAGIVGLLYFVFRGFGLA